MTDRFLFVTENFAEISITQIILKPIKVVRKFRKYFLSL